MLRMLVEKDEKAVLKKVSRLRTLDCSLDSDGIMRVGRRIQKATLSESLKNPVKVKPYYRTGCQLRERTHYS